MKRGIALGIAVAILLAISLYIVSPFWASRQIQKAAAAGELDVLADYIDTEAVKSDFQARLDAKLLDPEASVEAFLAPVMIDRLAGAAASPYGVAELLLGHEPGRPPADGKPIFTYRDGYVSPDRFRLRTHEAEAKQDGPSFLMKRHRLFHWRIAKIEPPADAA